MIRRVIDHAERIKIILVIGYPSLQPGSNREGFMNLIRHIITFVKDVDKFKASIAMVVTKVHELEEVDEQYRPISTDRIITFVVEYLASVKSDIQTLETEGRKYYYNDEFKKSSMQLIDILSTSVDGVHQRIGIFRQPTKTGPIDEQKLLIACKEQIMNLFHTNMDFTAKTKDDFGYTISDKATNEIHCMVEVLNNFFSDMSLFGTKLRFHLASMEYENQNDLYEIYKNISKTINLLSDVIHGTPAQCSPKQFYQKFHDVLSEGGLETLQGSIAGQLQAAEYFDFLQEVSAKPLRVAISEWTLQLSYIKTDCSAHCDWIKFLIAVFEKLSSYDINDIAEGLGDFYVPTGEALFLRFLNEFVRLARMEYKLNVSMDNTKIKMFNRILRQTLCHNIKCASQKGLLKVTGFNLRLSGVPKEILDASDVRNIQIFSLNKFFIDQDLIKVGANINLIIIAPAWEIVGDHIINLDGADGLKFLNPAKPGSFAGQKGANGLPGGNGGDGGTCLLIGRNFINGKALRITANGGNGGDGQVGGVGARGNRGAKAEYFDIQENGQLVPQPDIPFYARKIMETYQALTSKNGSRKFVESVEIKDSLPPNAKLLETKDDQGWKTWVRVLVLGANFRKIEKTFEIPGSTGLEGCAGGNGGIGGKNGEKGMVEVIATVDNVRTDFNITIVDGTPGQSGAAGQKGPFGENGESFKFIEDKKLSTSVFGIPMDPTVKLKWADVNAGVTKVKNLWPFKKSKKPSQIVQKFVEQASKADPPRANTVESDSEVQSNIQDDNLLKMEAVDATEALGNSFIAFCERSIGEYENYVLENKMNSISDYALSTFTKQVTNV